jgi:hypothetical protein
MRRIERQVIDTAEAMDYPGGAVVSRRRGDMAGVLRGLDLLEQRGMIPCFDTQDVVQTVGAQGLDVGGMRTATVCGDEEREVGMILAQLGKKALGGMPFTIIFGRPIVPHNRFRHQGNHGTQVRMNHRGPQHLMQRGDRTIAVAFVQTRSTVNGLGGNICCPIERQSRVAIKKRHRFKGLPTLELPKDALEHRTEQLGGDRVKDFAPMRVARDALNAVDGVQMTLGPFLVKGQERGRFEGTHGTGRHEGIREGNVDITPVRIRDVGEAASDRVKKCIGREMLAFFGSNNGHGKPHHENITSCKSGGIFASMFTKGQFS